MITELARRFAGWATPLVAAFDVAATTRELGFYEPGACLAQKQGKCPGKYFCADCNWSEGPLRERR